MFRSFFNKIFTYVSGIELSEILLRNVINVKLFVKEVVNKIYEIDWENVYNATKDFYEESTDEDFNTLIHEGYEIFKKIGFKCPDCKSIIDYFRHVVITIFEKFIKPVIFAEIPYVKTHVLTYNKCLYSEVVVIDIPPLPYTVYPIYASGINIMFTVPEIDTGFSVILMFPCPMIEIFDDRRFVTKLLHELTHHTLAMYHYSLGEIEIFPWIVEYFTYAIAEIHPEFSKFAYSITNERLCRFRIMSKMLKVMSKILQKCERDYNCVLNELEKIGFKSLDEFKRKYFPKINDCVIEKLEKTQLSLYKIFDILKECVLRNIPDTKFLCTIQELKV